MKRSMKTFIALVYLIGAAALLTAFTGVSNAASSPSKTEESNIISATPLGKDDCLKCHDKEPRDISLDGQKHKTAITCLDCHEGHRPRSPKNIPECSNCHTGKPHYELQGCLRCHNNPHTPLVISIAENVTDACLTCHTEQMAQLQQNESKHTKLSCSKCHREKHPYVPECRECHTTPHTPTMTNKDCLSCHQVHKPLAVTYSDDTPSTSCAACHDTAYNLLVASKYKHSKVACAACHKAKHKMIPLCQDCHGIPHPSKMMAKFPECGQCHGIAHDLNNK
ncbi:MAG: cytochrome C [Deltaproteobacteria bacterium RIFOXYD12_FULL_50_9]|nr:MAG: cytochrome C [Deltaproteobacteria bacterium RIFOXYD12_FULL_50_9]